LTKEQERSKPSLMFDSKAGTWLYGTPVACIITILWSEWRLWSRQNNAPATIILSTLEVSFMLSENLSDGITCNDQTRIIKTLGSWFMTLEAYFITLCPLYKNQYHKNMSLAYAPRVICYAPKLTPWFLLAWKALLSDMLILVNYACCQCFLLHCTIAGCLPHASNLFLYAPAVFELGKVFKVFFWNQPQASKGGTLGYFAPSSLTEGKHVLKHDTRCSRCCRNWRPQRSSTWVSDTSPQSDFSWKM